MTLEDFKTQAHEHGICDLSAEWDKATTKKAQIDLALSAKGIPYVSSAMAAGWGPTPEFVASEYAVFNHGEYVARHGRYSATMFVFAAPTAEDVEVHSTIAWIVNCKGNIHVSRLCELHLVDCDCTIVGAGASKVIVCKYGKTKVISKNIIVKERQNGNV